MIGIPVGIAAVTIKNRGRLGDFAFLQHYGFLVRSFRPACCAWEAVIATQTVLLVAVSVYGYLIGPFFQTLLFTALLVAFGVLLFVFKPYAQPAAGHVALQGLWCLLLTAFAAQTFLPTASLEVVAAGSIATSTSGTYAHYVTAMGAVVLVVNVVVFVISVLVKIVSAVDWPGLQRKTKVALVRLGSRVMSCGGVAPSNGWLQAAATSKLVSVVRLRESTSAPTAFKESIPVG